LIGDGRDYKTINDIIGEWYEFEVIGQMLLLIKPVYMSDRFPLLSKLLNTFAVL
jgi:hypothetical protein